MIKSGPPDAPEYQTRKASICIICTFSDVFIQSCIAMFTSVKHWITSSMTENCRLLFAVLSETSRVITYLWKVSDFPSIKPMERLSTTAWIKWKKFVTTPCRQNSAVLSLWQTDYTAYKLSPSASKTQCVHGKREVEKKGEKWFQRPLSNAASKRS